MKYIKLFENFEEYNPYDLMIMFPDERLKLFIEEIEKWEPNLNLVSDLIALGANVNVQDEKYGETPLHRAASRGRVEILQMLIGAGAKLNVQDKGGWTPFHWAASNGRVEVLRVLIDAGADLDLQDKEGRTALHWAARDWTVEPKLNVQDEDDYTPLHNVEVTRMLIGAGVKLNVQDEDGETPLHNAVFYGDIEIAKMLIDAKANVNVQNKYGMTPLHWAAHDGRVELARMLIDAGARKDIPNDRGKLPYDLTANQELKNMLEI
jgi:cytohesin